MPSVIFLSYDYIFLMNEFIWIDSDNLKDIYKILYSYDAYSFWFLILHLQDHASYYSIVVPQKFHVPEKDFTKNIRDWYGTSELNRFFTSKMNP
jgi:hypothetical protein